MKRRRKLGAVAEDAGHGKAEDAPEIEQAILDGRAGEGEAVIGLQRAGGLGGLRVGVLDVLRLVEDRGLPGDLRDGRRKRAELRVVDDDDVGLLPRGRQRGGGFPGPAADAQAGIKALRLGDPVVGDGLGADDEAGQGVAVRLGAQPRDPHEGLQGLAQAHVVGQHAAEPVGGEVGQEVVAVDLVWAQLGADRFRHGRRNAGLQFADPAVDLLDALRREELLRGGVGKLQGVEALGFGNEIARRQAEPGELFVVLGREIELQAPPAFVAQAHVAAARVEEQLGFLRREHEVGHVEDDFEIEPVDARLLHVEGHGAADRRVAQRGEFAVKLDGDFRRQALQPGDEKLGRLLGEPKRPAAAVVRPSGAERRPARGESAPGPSGREWGCTLSTAGES